jgi:O-antigen biosynthesis protein
VSIVVVVYGGGWDWLPSALRALRSETPEPWELVVVDNGPEDRVPAMFRADFGAATVIRNEDNVGYGVACNQGAAQARAPVLCFLNPDVIVCAGWLPPLLRTLDEYPRAGAVVPKKLNLDGTLQEAGAFADSRGHTCVFGFGDDPQAPEHCVRREIDFGSASCLCMKRETFEQVGGFDPIYEAVYFEDTDLCFRLREHGLATVYEPHSQVVHALTTSMTLDEALRLGERNRSIFFERWQAELAGRPTCVQIADDPAWKLAARDFHASRQPTVGHDR